MADAPEAQTVLPVLPENHSHINDDLQKSLAALAHKHVNVSYMLIGVLVLILAVGVVGAIFGNKLYNKELERAEKAEQLYDASKKNSEEQVKALNQALQASEQARAAAEQKAADQQKQIDANTARAAADDKKILAPGKTASEAYADASKFFKLSSPLKIVPSTDNSEQLLAFRVPDIQLFTAAGNDLQAANANLALKDQQLAEKQSEINGLKTDLKNAQDALAAEIATDKLCQAALNKYKTVAKVSRWRHIWNGMKKGIEIGGAIIAGYEIGKRL